MLILGIETTCDETSCAIVKDGSEILAHTISSQIDLHAEFGGVVPELSSRRHADMLLPVIQETLEEAALPLSSIDALAVAYGPGLIGALLIGLTTAKTLAISLGKPLIGVNHVEAHLYAAIMDNPAAAEFPALGIVLSGGHTALIKIEALGTYQLIGQTVDDAIGEAFDKTAKMLGLPYPGGPQIEFLAAHGNPHRFAFKGGKVKGHPLNFSFSGLKTAVLYALKKFTGAPTDQDKADIAASFQRAALSDIVEKALQAAQKYGCRSLVFGGGVTNNQALRRLIDEKASGLAAKWPSVGLSLDNAAMIAGLGYYNFMNNRPSSPHALMAATRIPFPALLG